MCSKGCVCVHLVQAVCVCMCTLLGWRLCKCTNLAGFAWVQAGRQLDNGPCSACWKNPFKGAAGRECHIIFFFSVFLLHCCSISASRSVRLSRMGDGNGPDWQGLWKIWQVPLSPTHFVSPLTLCCYRLERGHIQDEKQVSQEKCESLYAFSWYQHQLPRSPSSPPFSLCLLSTSVSFPFLHCLFGSVALLSLSLSSLSGLLSLSFSLCSLFTLGLPECVFASVC